MKNLKIRVANGVENKEAQELFFELGCTWSGDSKDIFDFDMPEYIVNWNNGYITVGDDFDKNRQEINLPELRDMVVLKRNSIKDATHEGAISGKYYVSSSNKAYRFDLCWVSSHYNEDGIKNCLKPIEKKEMKEYLEPHPNGKYVFIKAENPLHPSWIEIPEGADIAVKYKNGAIEFFKENYSMFWLVKFSKWVETMNAPKFYKHGDIFWQRHKQPEELPLADGEKSLNNQYAEIEQVRRNTYGFTPERAARISLKTEGAYLNISDTLKQRESTYGSFEDVASVTQDLLSVLKRTGLESLPKPHKEALHMICSKMARIVNGDFNYKDNWHDIGGYAKLIEDLKVENSSED